MSASPSDSIRRRHDLDALRAIAMLLGILLHGALSFIPGIGEGWAVADSRPAAGFAVMLACIHGFRMQLFFLISGFFTAMLWRKRGLRPLLWHRFKRIFLPLLLGLVTVIPAMWAVSIGIGMADAEGSAGKATPRVATDEWSAAAYGDITVLKQSVTEETDLDAIHPTWNSTLLMVAGLHDHPDIVSYLLESGASPGIANASGDTALHMAAFFGSAESAKVLIDAGAPLHVTNQQNAMPLANTESPWWLTKMIAGMADRPVNEAEVNDGREQIAAWIRDAQEDQAGSESPVVPQPTQRSSQRSAGLGILEFPLFGHLWFLYFLCWLVVGFTFTVQLGARVGKALPSKRLTTSIWRFAWCIPATAALQGLMNQPGNTFGPDTSISIAPNFTVLAYYAIFFGFGALYFDAKDDDSRLTRFWPAMLVFSALLFPAGLALGKEESGGSPHWLSAGFQATYAWLMCFGLMGLFQSVFSQHNKTMRYLSDASYWMYLVHIPLIIPVQYWVRDWNVNPILKFIVICGVTFGILLISYQILCRHTPIGWLLNGKKKREPNATLATQPIEAQLVPASQANS